MVRTSVKAQSLISLVCERPALWDKTCDDYKERELKEMSWREICTHINTDYNTLPPKQKDEFTKSIIKRWTHIRDSWFKSMKYGYDEVTMMPPKPYVYHDEMQFMQKILKCKPSRCHPKISQLSNTHFEEFYRDRNEISSSNCISKDADKNQDIKNAADGAFSTVTLKQEPNCDNYESSEFTINDMQEDFNECEERKVPTPVKSAKVAATAHARAHCQRSVGRDLYENRHCNFFKGILPSVDGLDEDHVLQFQSGVISLLRNLRQFQKLKSYRSRKNCEGVSIRKHNARRMLTRQQSLDSVDVDSEMEYLTDD